MVLPSSGPISLLDVQNEFGGSNPIGLDEYYLSASSVPSSGTISLSNFYNGYAWPISQDSYYYGSGSYSFSSDVVYPPVTTAITFNYSWNVVDGYLRAFMAGGYDYDEIWTTGYIYPSSYGSSTFTVNVISGNPYIFGVFSNNNAINAPNYIRFRRPGTNNITVYYAQFGAFD